MSSPVRIAILPAAILSLAAMLGCRPTEIPADAKQMEETKMDHDNTSSPHAVETRYPPNHLADQTSLYLLMHAHNPVDW